MTDTAACMKCGTIEHLHLLDGKNPDGDENGDFDQIECVACYGPGWAPLAGLSDLQLSVAPNLTLHYQRYAAKNPEETQEPIGG